MGDAYTEVLFFFTMLLILMLSFGVWQGSVFAGVAIGAATVMYAYIERINK